MATRPARAVVVGRGQLTRPKRPLALAGDGGGQIDRWSCSNHGDRSARKGNGVGLVAHQQQRLLSY